jgi:hypothetical protein
MLYLIIPRNFIFGKCVNKNFLTFPLSDFLLSFLSLSFLSALFPCLPERNAVEPKDPIGKARTPFVGSFGYAQDDRGAGIPERFSPCLPFFIVILSGNESEES